jgi:hypothetical protein
VRYLTLSADYGRVSLRDAMRPVKLDLSVELQRDLEAWNDDYQRVIPLDGRAREQAAAQIDGLDDTGRELAARVRDECGADAKVAYYSEGLGRLIS